MTRRVVVRSAALTPSEAAAIVAAVDDLDRDTRLARPRADRPAWRVAALREQTGRTRHTAPHHLRER